VRLKRLELAGFKTFADRTQLEFAPRITAIVGPNGSGKSNIFDAIRWVLGEGSLRALRGVRNEDVIFAGSEKRRALALAEVTLTLDNTDGLLMMPRGAGEEEDVPTPLAFAEVTVMRRALKAADSQYQINGLPCRLRDIQTMFLGTGLGGHSYALITQGEVDHMLEATPEERRMILEEAAGVAKYKRRRHDAERRMAAAETLLLRAADILGELEAHVAQLAQQAEAARQYQAHTKELRELELALQVEEIRRLTRAQKRVRDQLEQVAGKRQEIDRALRALEEEREALDRRTLDAGREWEETQRALMRLTERRTAEVASVQLIAERRRGVAAQRERLARELDRHRGEAGALRGERDILAATDAGLAAEQDRMEAESAGARTLLLQTEAEVAGCEERIEQARTDVRALAGDRARTFNEIAAAAAHLAGYQDRLTALGERAAYLEQQRRATEERQQAGRSELAHLTAELEARRGTVAALRAEGAQHLEEREVLLTGLRRLEVEREALRARLSYLEDAQAQYRGYDAGARELMLARAGDPGRFAGLHGAIAEFLRVPKDFRTAVEAALGPHRSTLIVDSIATATMLRGHLNEHGGGEAAFLPIALVRPGKPLPLPGPVASDPGLCGRAVDLVGVTGEYPEAARALLEDMVIVRDLAAALRVREAGYAGRVVTLAGDGLSPEGVLWTGRRATEHGTIVGRAEEIAEMRSSLDRIEEAAARHARRSDELAGRLRELEAFTAQADSDVGRLAQAREEAERRLILLDAEGARLNEEAASAAAERQGLESAAAGEEALVRRLEAQAAAHDARIAEIESESGALAARVRDQTAALRALRDRITSFTVAATEVAGRRTALRSRVDELERGLAQIAARSGELEAEARNLDGDAARLAEEDAAARARCAALAEEGARLEERLSALDAERSGVAERRMEIEGQHKEAARKAEMLADEAHRIELRQAQVDAEIGSARRRLEEEFGRGYERAAEDVPETIERDATLGRIEALRGLIAALGPVNLIAIEEHRMAEERAAALRSQFEDVRGAVAALRALIAELEGVIRTRFDETFRAVNEEFSELFVRLFGGGRAGLDLVALEGSDEPGIDIVVQPPGKALRSLGALSGGERVMVALALIFAMLRVRPSPFCVFDEVEAALDEANTRKVARILQEIAEQTQIIIITHNKATMEACDVLFGVTMEEPGVSRMVSMRLQDRDRLLEGQPVG
jgi:chromosome segregation protein